MLRSAAAVSQQWTDPSLDQERPSKSGFSEAIRKISQSMHRLKRKKGGKEIPLDFHPCQYEKTS